MKKRVTSVLVICILLGALLACSHDRLIDETEAKQILEEYLDSCELLGPDESGAEYELDSGYEKKVYAEPAYQFSLCYKPDVPIVGGRRISEWAITKAGKTIYEYDIVNDIWVEGSVYGFGDFSETVQERGYLEDTIGTFYIVSPNGRYRLEMSGEKSFRSFTCPELVQVRDMQNKKVIWSDSQHVNIGFLWSGDGRYLAIRSSGDGGAWEICRLLDCNSGEELHAPDIQALCAIAKTVPPAMENGITGIMPLRWLPENTLLLEVYWDADSSSVQRVKGTVEYQVDVQKYRNLKLEEELKG